MSKIKLIKIVLISLIFILFVSGCSRVKKEAISGQFFQLEETIHPEIIESTILRRLDGRGVRDGDEIFLPIALVIDNLPGKVFSTGLDSASIIYEIPVEGGLTRLLAIFDYQELPPKIGPIRSARPAFAEIAEEYKAAFVHAGGSPEVLQKIKSGFYQIYNLDEISWQGFYFKRDYNLERPHNLFIGRESIKKFIEDRKISPKADFDPWLFDQESVLIGRSSEIIQIDFSSQYSTIWRYNQENEFYQVWQNNKLLEAIGGINNLIIQYTDINIIDQEGRRKIRLTGQGKGLICQKGICQQGIWKKEFGRTRFYNQDGEEIKLLPGKIWISIVSDKMAVRY